MAQAGEAPDSAEADSESVTTKASATRARGRPRVFSEQALHDALHFSYARHVRTRRGAQDLVYRKFAVAALELYRETHPKGGARLAWLLAPTPRHSLLTELGRVARPWSDDEGVLHWTAHDVARLVDVAFAVVEAKPSTKEGVAMIRALKRREPR
jgi:hypothetical protein